MFSKSKSTFTAVVLGITLLSTAAFAAGPHDSKMFLKKAASNGMAEVSLANLALRMASNPDIQSFAKHMIEDHTAANDKVMELAKGDKVMLDKDLTAKQKATENRLSKLNDADRAFDRAYLKQAIKDHQETIKLFEKQAEHGTDADVKAFATETLPKLKMHLDMASALDAKLNSKSNMN